MRVRTALVLWYIGLMGELNCFVPNRPLKPELDGTRFKGLRGNQLPPPGTSYFEQFGNCGRTFCNNKKGKGCSRMKRSILQPPNFGEDYVAGGTELRDSKFPWVAKLEFKEIERLRKWWNKWWTQDAISFRSQCTVVMISSRHALTARHCFDAKKMTDFGQTYDVEKDSIRVVFEVPSGSPVRSPLLKVFIPEKHNLQSDHDICMIEFEEISMTQFVRPICLPIHGIPVNVKASYAGYGHLGRVRVGSSRVARSRYMQEMPGLDITRDNVVSPPLKVFSDGHGKFSPSSPTNVETAHYIIKMPLGQKNLCTGDSGGPIMWFNSQTQRWMLIGIFTGKDSGTECYTSHPTKARDLFVMKVTPVVNWAISKMTLPGHGGSCMVSDCKHQGKDVMKRTWILKAKKADGSEAYTKLAKPCQYVEEAQGRAICPTKYTSDRVVEYTIGDTWTKDKNWAYCNSRCQTGPGWDSSHYLDEITAGSFIQERPTGVEFVEPIQLHTAVQVAREDYKPYEGNCDINNKISGQIYCPKIKDDYRAHKCIFPENICDGVNNCDDGWDESPHLCIGKCDFWKQYQYPQYRVKKTSLESKFTAASVRTAKDCQNICKKQDMCNRFTWEAWDQTCDTFTAPGHPLQSQWIINSVPRRPDPKKKAVRGPKSCWTENERVCEPTMGPPHRSGIFLIQAYNGMFVTVPPAKPRDTPSLEKEPVYVESRPYGILARSKYSNAKNYGQWRFHYYPSLTLNQSFVTIEAATRPGWFLTKELGQSNIHLRRENYAPLRNNFRSKQHLDNPYLHWKTGHHWFIEPVRKERGFTEVKLFTTIDERQTLGFADGDRYYLTAPNGMNYDEYNTDTTMTSNANWRLENSDRDADPNVSPKQIFRLLDCGYDETFTYSHRKFTQKSYASTKWGPIIRKVIGPNPYQSQTTREYTEAFLSHVFGVSHAIVEQALVDRKINELVTRIEKTYAESTTIFDYTMRMRNGNLGFVKMFNTWDAYRTANMRDVDQKGKALVKQVKADVAKGFISL